LTKEKIRRDVLPLEGYHPEIGLLLATLEDSIRTWRYELGPLPVEAMVFQQRDQGHSLGAVMLHMADAEAYWFEQVVGGKSRPRGEHKLLLSRDVHQYGGRWPVPPAMPLEWYFELQDRIHKRAISALLDQLPEREIERAERVFTVRWIVAHVISHDAYHGGQLVLLRDLWKSQISSERKAKRTS